jgi:ketosteroid isomerase-like protein
MSQENVEMTRRGFALWNSALTAGGGAASDAAIAEMVDSYHADAIVDFSRTTPDLPIASGSGAMLGWMKDSAKNFSDVRVEATALVDAGDAVVAEAFISGTGASSGATLGMGLAYVFSYRDGKVASATSYPTLREALKAVGLEE